MLCWPCDLIVAADNAEFSDPVVLMGNSGIEYKAHAWEFGARKAKEMLFTGCALTAAEAQQIGMVNKVVPLEELMPATMELANRIAQQDSFALRMAKRTVNHAVDAQGFTAAIDAGFDMHHLSLTRSAVVTGGAQYLADLRVGKRRDQEGVDPRSSSPRSRSEPGLTGPRPTAEANAGRPTAASARRDSQVPTAVPGVGGV